MNPDKHLRRYWFEFIFTTPFPNPPGTGLGCGVTAHSQEDAIKILDEKIFTKIKRPEFSNVIEDVDIQTLDHGHVISNMGVPIYRGVWFPLGYE